MKQKSVGLTLRALILALVLSLVAGTPALPPLEGVAYAQSSGLTASVAPDNSSVSLSWNAVSGADSYEIWRGEVVNNVAQWGTYATVDGEDTTTYTDSNVTAGTTYAYGVRSVTGGTAAGWTGPYPNVTIPGGIDKPTGAPIVTAVADGTSAVDVTWTDVSSATGYHIQFWHADLEDWEQISGDQTSPYKHTGLTPGTEYYYSVRAFNAGGMGPWSRAKTDDNHVTLEATTDVPELSKERRSRTTVKLDWTETDDAAEYELQRRKITTDSTAGTALMDTGAWARLARQVGTTYTDNAANYSPATIASGFLPYMVKYEYRVQAIGSGGEAGAWSNVESVSVPQAGAALPAPARPRASPRSDSSIQVSWDPVTGADFYELQWKSGDRGFSEPIRVDKPASGNPIFNHTGLSPSTKYTYEVRSVDVNGHGDWSASANATTHSTADAALQMPKVTGLMVTDETSDDDAVPRKAKLTWNAVSDATHYEIQRFDPDGGAWGDLVPDPETTAPTAGAVTRIVAASSPSHTDTIATGAPGKVYFYVVSAVNSGPDGETSTDVPAPAGPTPNADNEMGEWSEFKSVTFNDLDPAMPPDGSETGAITAINATGSSIWVTWRQDDGNGTSTGTATSWTLQWHTDQSTAWRSIPVTGPATREGTDTFRTITYHHTDLSGNATYYYRVRAENSGGESDFTDRIEVVLGNTLAPPTGLQAVDATNSSGPRIKVSWSPVAGADSYEVQRYGAGGSTGTAWGDLGGTESTAARGQTGYMATTEESTSVTNATVSTGANLVANRTYLYRVRTVKEGIASGWSAPVGGTTRMSAPSAPTLLATSTGMSMIRLSWTEVPGATAYHLEWLEGMEADAIFESGATRDQMRISGGSHRHYVHRGLKAGTMYSYRLRAELPQNVYSAWTTAGTEEGVIHQNTKPAQPDLTASNVTVGSVTLKWVAVPFAYGADPTATGASANSRLTAANNYQIQRRVSGGDWEDVVLAAGAPNFSNNAIEYGPVGSKTAGCDGNNCMLIDDGVDGTDSDSNDDGLSKSTRYSYRIRATVTRGTGAAAVTYTSYWDYLSVTTPAK